MCGSLGIFFQCLRPEDRCASFAEELAIVRGFEGKRRGGVVNVKRTRMGVPDVDQAKRRLQDILRKAQKLEIPTQEVISTKTARKLLARSKNLMAWTIWIGIFVVILSAVVYVRWPTQEVETVRTVLRRTVS